MAVFEPRPVHFSAVNILNPDRLATAESPTALLFCEMRPATVIARACAHFQALVKPADGTKA